MSEGLVHTIGEVPQPSPSKHVSPDVLGAGIAHGIAQIGYKDLADKIVTMEQTIANLQQTVSELEARPDPTPPVGTYMYCEYDPNDRYPGTTWERLAQGMFLMASGADYTNGQTYGANTHTLSVNEMPIHSHTWTGLNASAGTVGQAGSYIIRMAEDTKPNWPGRGINNTGGSQPHNNIPLSTAVPLWHRTS